MNGIELIFCASQTSTTISLGAMDEPSPSSSSSSRSTILLSRSPAIDRHNPIITDSCRRPIPSPTNSPPRVTTKPHTQNLHKKKSNISNHQKIPHKEITAKKHDNNHGENLKISTGVRRNSWSCTKPGDLTSPPGSTRYLLGDERVMFGNLSDFGPARKIFPADKSKTEAVKTNGSCDVNAKPPSSAEGSANQVVVLRVSLHCRGCEKKMRKHISRMEGVSSFNIDFAAKKVTVMGNITPLEVLSSISKVKNAQIWSPTISSSTLNPMGNSEMIRNEYKGAGAYVTDK